MPIFVVILFLCSGITLPLMLMAWSRRSSRGAMVLCLFLFSVGVTSFSYAMGLTSTDLEQKIFWNHAEYLGGAYLSALMLTVTLVFAGYDKWVRPGPMILLFLVPVMMMVANWTNAWHHLFYTRVWMRDCVGHTALAKSRGPLYIIGFSYIYLTMAVNLLLLVRSLRHVQEGPHRTRLLLLFAAFLMPVFFNLPYLFRLVPCVHFNLTLMGFFFTSILLSVAIFHHDLLGAVPLARSNVIEQMPAALFVLDSRGFIADMNKSACAFLERHCNNRVWCSGKQNNRSCTLESLMPELKPLNLEKAGDLDSLRIGDHWYRLTTRRLANAGILAGYYVLIDDITDDVKADQAQAQLRACSDYLVRRTHAIVYTLKPDGTFSFVSPNWFSVAGYAIPDVKGHHFKDFVLEEDWHVCQAFFDEVIQTQSQQSGVEYRMRHADGSIRWYTDSLMPYVEKDGQVTEYFGVSQDITSVKMAQERLREANEQLERLVASREAELQEAISETLIATEKEAARIGEDIHDGLCQDLIGLTRMVEKMETEVSGLGQSALCQTVEGIREQTARLAGVARTFSHDLTLHELEVQTISEALHTLARRTGQLFQTEVEINTGSELVAFNHEQTVHLFRIIREAVANAVKHAHASHIWIDIVREPAECIISISNDGHPIEESSLRSLGMGVKQMKMRARLLGARFSITRNPQEKSVVEVIMPYKSKDLV